MANDSIKISDWKAIHDIGTCIDSYESGAASDSETLEKIASILEKFGYFKELKKNRDHFLVVKDWIEKSICNQEQIKEEYCKLSYPEWNRGYLRCLLDLLDLL